MTLYKPLSVMGITSWLILAGSAAIAVEPARVDIAPAPQIGENLYDYPPNRPVHDAQTLVASDTLVFGYVDEDGFAVLGDEWTFDHGGADPLEGWYAADITAQADAYFRRIDDPSWDADPENGLDAPVLSGSGSVWCGVTGSEALGLCWDFGIGYGNTWCQRLVSPLFVHDGSSDVEIDWIHFNETEPDFDFTSVYLELESTGDRTELRRYDGDIGLAPDHPASPPVGVADSETLTAADFAGESAYRIVIEFTSDGGWSDEDGLYTTSYGAGGFDDISIDGTVATFETGLDGWTAEPCVGVGSYLGVAPVTDYNIEDACECELTGNVLEFHNDDDEHEYGMRVHARSAPVDLASDANLPGPGTTVIFARWSQYSVMPQANGVFYRPGWDYFPFVCELTGEEGWSGRVGQNTFFFVGEDPVCSENANFGTEADDPVPTDSEQVRFVYEVYASCDAFAISEEVCRDQTNITPLLDNISIRVSKRPIAPPISFDNGLRWQDGFAQGTDVNDPTMPGNANVTRNRNFGNTLPFTLGDSLYISGPLAGSDPETQWEAKLWFRVPRVGPAADSRYTTWRDKVADGKTIDGENAEWTFAFMDSFQVGTNAATNKFVSYFREDDDDFDIGAGELKEGNEIIEDLVLFPGTQVDYFVTSNYIGNSQHFLLPDTSGGFALEFEILPSWRDDGGVLKYPCLLYIDAFNAGAQYYIDRALDAVGVDHDRYDYLDASSGWKAPMARGTSELSNNGCTLPQLMGYRGLLINTGTSNVTSIMWPEDFVMFSDWLTAEICEGQTTRQGLIFNGNGIANSMSNVAAALLTSTGTSHVDDKYWEFSGDLSNCVRLEAPMAGGEAYGTTNSAEDYEYDAFGNWCPTQNAFDVLSVVGSGVGNRVYARVDDLSDETPWAQVVSENLTTDNYRTIVDGVSYNAIASVDPIDECVASEAAILEAATNEIRSALEWIYGVENLPGLCEDPCTTTDAGPPPIGEGGVAITTSLQPARPNPFNPRTTLSFRLAESADVDVHVYDTGGRHVRTIANGKWEAGEHEVVWDGTDDKGRNLAAGVYWVKMSTGGYDYATRLIRVR